MQGPRVEPEGDGRWVVPRQCPDQPSTTVSFRRRPESMSVAHREHQQPGTAPRMDSGLRRNDTVRLDGLVLGDAPNHRTSSSGLTRGDCTCGALGKCRALGSSPRVTAGGLFHGSVQIFHQPPCHSGEGRNPCPWPSASINSRGTAPRMDSGLRRNDIVRLDCMVLGTGHTLRASSSGHPGRLSLA